MNGQRARDVARRVRPDAKNPPAPAVTATHSSTAITSTGCIDPMSTSQAPAPPLRMVRTVFVTKASVRRYATAAANAWYRSPGSGVCNSQVMAIGFSPTWPR